MPVVQLQYIPRRSRPIHLLTMAGALLGALACGGGGSSTSTGTLSATLTPNAISIAQGTSGQTTLNITRTGSFTGPVTITTNGAPTGVTVTADPATIPTGSTSSTITIDVAGSVAPSSGGINIVASGTGVSDQTNALTVTVTAAAAGSFSLAAAPNALAIAAGAAAKTSTITITRTAPFAGTVAMSVTGAPPGMTATLNPTSVPGATSTLSVSATSAVANGPYTLVVRGTSAGFPDATTNVVATVSGGAAKSISLTLNPTTLSVAQGAAAKTSAVTIARNGGFTGAVGLALTGAPTGMTASVNPTSVAAASNTATISVAASGALATGTYNLTLTGSGTGITNVTATLPVTVTGSSTGGITVAFCAEQAPLWVAAQDGSGAWAHLSPTSANTYTYSFPSGKGGVAVVDTVGQGFSISVLYATAAEFAVNAAQVNTGCGGKTVNGTVANVPTGDAALISLGGAFGTAIGGGSNNFQLTGVNDGPRDLLATRAIISTFAIDEIILRRSLNIANNGTITGALDFGAAEAFAPAAANLTLAGLQTGETASVDALYASPNGGLGVLFSKSDVGNGTVAYAGIPGAKLQGNEVEQLAAAVNGTNDFRTAGVYFNAVADRSLTMGPVLNTPTVTDVSTTTPYDRPRVQLTSQTQYGRLLIADFNEGTGTTARSASILATSGYLGATPTTWDLTLPDLSGVSGFMTTWGLHATHASEWDITVLGGSSSFVDATPANGSLFYEASRSSPSTRPPLASRSRSRPAVTAGSRHTPLSTGGSR